MEQLKALLAQVQASDNPVLLYILGAVAILVAFIVLRSLLATAILISGVAVAILIIFLVLGKPLPKINFDKLNLPDLSNLLPKENQEKDTSPSADTPDTKDISVPTLPGVTPSADPLKDAILEDRHKRSNRTGNFGLGF